ncbi:hypothetical protein EUGRSUZ_F02939 [Eucalyptus grandis]|uniref:Uncharacterized protein n=2 Tax=Eucalyptus grandis TaxID=71139 RepID=A0ACC3KKE6_EUCGR|nr:hypothetical protein EUGRSUZ_F02939 [Eucalyptus grandis]
MQMEIRSTNKPRTRYHLEAKSYSRIFENQQSTSQGQLTVDLRPKDQNDTFTNLVLMDVCVGTLTIYLGPLRRRHFPLF